MIIFREWKAHRLRWPNQCRGQSIHQRIWADRKIRCIDRFFEWPARSRVSVPCHVKKIVDSHFVGVFLVDVILNSYCAEFWEIFWSDLDEIGDGGLNICQLSIFYREMKYSRGETWCMAILISETNSWRCWNAKSFSCHAGRMAEKDWPWAVDGFSLYFVSDP